MPALAWVKAIVQFESSSMWAIQYHLLLPSPSLFISSYSWQSTNAGSPDKFNHRTIVICSNSSYHRLWLSYRNLRSAFNNSAHHSAKRPCRSFSSLHVDPAWIDWTYVGWGLWWWTLWLASLCEAGSSVWFDCLSLISRATTHGHLPPALYSLGFASHHESILDAPDNIVSYIEPKYCPIQA